jgi:O-antigen/teichoic acid export membrane protein
MAVEMLEPERSPIDETFGPNENGMIRNPPFDLSWRLPKHHIAFLSKPWVYGAFIPGVTILNAAVGMLLPMFMSPLLFGEYALVVTFFQYGLIFDLGLGQLVDRWIPAALGRREFEDAERLGQRFLWLRLYIGIAVFGISAALMVGLASLRELPFGLGAGLLSALAGILYMCALGPGFIYRARSARRNYAFTIGALSLGLCIARPAGLLAGGLMGCFTSLALWYLAFLILFHWRMPPRFRNRPSISESFALVVQGLPFFATSIVWSFYLTANRWFASDLIGPEAFGHFAFATNIYSLLVGAVGGFSAFYYPKIVGRIASETRYALSGTLMTDCSKLVLGVGGIVAIGILLAAPLLELIYPKYYQSVPAVRVLLAAVPAMCLASWLLPLSLSSGRKPWIDGLLIYPSATAILYLAIHALKGPLGVDGIAGASVIAALPLIAMQLLQLRHADVLKTSAVAALLGVTTLVTSGLCLLTWYMG